MVEYCGIQQVVDYESGFIDASKGRGFAFSRTMETVTKDYREGYEDGLEHSGMSQEERSAYSEDRKEIVGRGWT